MAHNSERNILVIQWKDSDRKQKDDDLQNRLKNGMQLGISYCWLVMQIKWKIKHGDLTSTNSVNKHIFTIKRNS